MQAATSRVAETLVLQGLARGCVLGDLAARFGGAHRWGTQSKKDPRASVCLVSVLVSGWVRLKSPRVSVSVLRVKRSHVSTHTAPRPNVEIARYDISRCDFSRGIRSSYVTLSDIRPHDIAMIFYAITGLHKLRWWAAAR
jgi:hypothetical protein